MYFEEDAQAIEAAEEKAESATSDYIPEDDMIEDIKEAPKAEGKQGDYFTREAGVKDDGSLPADRKEKPKSSGDISMSLYKDR